ncbi:5-hydroxytryptamine receptor 3A-like isoform X2 [Puntigrus tetrazona]|nr:5-hydroxytryptamine receptor 3A-like isoform X2 [Puntigrus tetrazona]XP_043088747.1 5-hydroxytryptamine receptor 3A-like isoform X2 [Puntigrus tetrazona]XP_043088748.1 5-hydroxytryptamine receptor 3A-like isoform X2 [Puntigrus tetrazona]
MVLPRRISLLLLFCSPPLVFAADNSTETPCDRRCLANARVEKELVSAPQNDNCTMTVKITSMQYEMLSFDTKVMQMNSRIKVNMEWKDPDLGWMQERSRIPTIVLPIDKIWIPRIVLDNACVSRPMLSQRHIYIFYSWRCSGNSPLFARRIETTMEPYTNDVQVRRDGTVSHAVVLFTTVSCQINLFNYPFVEGSCPVAINGWCQKTCSLALQIADNVTLVGGSRGEWQTTRVVKTVDASKRVYLQVALTINPFTAFVTLILPSGLILLADLVSFALPFEGGERNSFKVTLVLSFTMFLLILSDHLPNGGHCNPLLYYHFSFCLVCLVMSMLVSIVLTRLAADDSFLVCRGSAKVHPSDGGKANDSLDREKDTSAITTKSGHPASETTTLQKIANLLETMDAREKKIESKVAFAYLLDKFCFGFFIIIYVLYAIILIAITRTDICKVNNLDFWDESHREDENFDYSYSN